MYVNAIHMEMQNNIVKTRKSDAVVTTATSAQLLQHEQIMCRC